MKQYRTYCSECDAEVLVNVDPDQKTIDPDEVVCADEGDECAETGCPLTGLTGAELAAKLEFLPGSGLEEGKGAEPRTLDEAEELLGDARIASFRRQFRRREE
jgi:hypothetical protein